MRVSQPGPVGQLGRLSETAIAFAGANWAFLVQFSGAEVSLVSAVPCWERVVVLVVSTSPCCCALCAKKFALHAQNTPESAFLRLLGEFFRGNAAGGAVLGEFFRGNASGGAVLGEFFAETRLERPCWANLFAEEPLERPCWANFFAEDPPEGLCWASSFADRQSWDPAGRVVLRRGPGSQPFDWQC